jgi:hypothetical protein
MEKIFKKNNLFNIKTICLFIFIFTNITIQAQEYGMFIKSTFGPARGWYGSHAGQYSIIVGNSGISISTHNKSNTEDETEYNFFYINDNPTEIVCSEISAGNYDDTDCNVTRTINYNKGSFNEAYFSGCIGESEIYGIHLAATADNQRCISEQISLNYGWNWQYSYDNTTWTDFPTMYQEKRTISFKINELNGYTGKNKIHFRTGYGTQFTNSIQYNIIGCSPELAVNPPITSPTKCKNEASGNVTLEFKTELKDGDKFLFNIWDAGGVLTSRFVIKDSIKNNRYTWKGLAEGNYTMKYQAQGINDLGSEVGLSAVSTAPFTIGSQPQLSFTAIATQPKCSTDKGSIQISPTGGTPPYKYSTIFNNVTLTSTNNLAAGDYTITVSDANDCIIPTQPIKINLAPAPIIITGTPTDVTINNGTDGAINNFSISNATTPFQSETWKKGNVSISKPGNLTALSAGEYTVTIIDNKGCTSPTNPTPFIINQPDILTVKIETPNTIACNGGTGTLTATPSGGYPFGTNVTRNYTYKWYKCDDLLGTNSVSIPLEYTEQITNRKTGFYKVIVSDSKTESIPFIIKLEENSQITASSILTPALCKGDNGSISLTVAGGTAPYAINWTGTNIGTAVITNNNTLLTAIAETYYYAITDNLGCKLSTNPIPQDIEEPEDPFLISLNALTQPSPTLDNGTISIEVNDGYGNYNYSWKKNGIAFTPSNNVSLSGLGNGIYSVTVTDKNQTSDLIGCSKTIDNIILKSLSATINIINPINCIGDTATLEAMPIGGSGSYTYQWFKGTDTNPVSTSKILTNCDPANYTVIVNDTNYDFSANQTLSNPTNPPISMVTSDVTAVNCYGGSDGTAYIEVKDGTPVNGAYTFIWDKTGTISNTNNTSTISGLTAGNYTVTVKDKFCTKDFSFIILQPQDPITIPAEIITPVLINGQNTGAITFPTDPSGGTGGYTYNWTSSTDASFTPKSTKNISTLKAGFYTLKITDSKSCSISKVYEIKETLKLTVNLKTSEPIKCNGEFNGELIAEVKGGIAPYKYIWKKDGQLMIEEESETISNLGIGKYSVFISDSANSGPTGPFAEAEQLNYSLTQPTTLSVALTNQTNVLCYDAKTGSINITINGGTQPYAIQWKKESVDYAVSEDLTSLNAGSYGVFITDNHGCKTILSNPVLITQPDAPLLISDLEVKNLSGFETQNGSISVEISGGTPTYVYEWRNKGISSIIGNKPTLDKLPIGTYELTLVDSHNCSIKKEYTLTQPDKLVITSITQETTSAIKCYGDKTGILEATIIGGVLPYTYNWYNILTPNITASTTNPSETLVAGTYELKVTDANGNTFTLKSNPISEPTLLKINSSTKNVSCKNGNDGAITIAPSGGTGTSTINWSTGNNTNINTINNLYAGSYTVNITDKNQCHTTETIKITEPEILYVSKITKNPPSALGLQDGSIEIQISGGTPNYNYLWYNGSKNLIYSDLNQPSNTSINNIFAGQYFVTVKDANGCAIVEKDLDKVDPLVLSVNQINIVKCNGNATASIKAIASGGTPIYYYKWYKSTDPLNAVGIAETLVNVTAGTYYVVLSDSFGLSKQSDNITITEPAILNNTLLSEYTLCGDAKDWSITTAPIGGTAPYTYLWNVSDRTDNLQNVVPANYSVLVTDNQGCTITKNITITAPIHLATAETITKPTCFEGSDATIVLASSGGQGPYTYLWNTGEKSNILRNASAKEYSVAVTDSKGCVIDKKYTIENPPKDVINLGEDVTLCFDQSLTINSTIADDKAQYSWTSTKGFTSNNSIITVSEPADYTLVVTNHLGCKATDIVKISSQNTAVSSEFAVSSQVFTNEKFIIVDISNPIPDSIEWSLPAEATIISKNKDFAELSFSKAGEYELTLNTKKGNCTATQTKKIVVIEGEYIDPDSSDLMKKFDLKIYPNPSNGIFTIDVTLDKVMPAHVKIYNLNNNLIIDSKYDEGKDAYKFNFSLSGLIPGVYFVLVESQQGNQLRKIIIN